MNKDSVKAQQFTEIEYHESSMQAALINLEAARREIEVLREELERAQKEAEKYKKWYEAMAKSAFTLI